MDILTFYDRCSRLLSPSVKRRVKQTLPAFKTRAYPSRDPTSLYRAALDVVRPRFPSNTPKQHDILAVYLLASVLISESGPNQPRNPTRDRMNQEMAERVDLRWLLLQSKMQNENRQYTTVSNVMKVVRDTDNATINNVR